MHHNEKSDLSMVKNLMQLRGLNVLKAALLMNVQRTNLSSWLNGRDNVFSASKIEGMLSALGMVAISDPSHKIRHYRLSPDIVHMWQIVPNSKALEEVLIQTESKSTLENLYIFSVKVSARNFNLLRKTDSNNPLTILVTNSDPENYNLQLKALPFGTFLGQTNTSMENWINWMSSIDLPPFVVHDELNSEKKIAWSIEDRNLSKISQENESTSITAQDFIDNSDKLKIAMSSDEGMQSVILDLIENLRHLDPKTWGEVKDETVINPYTIKKLKM